MQVVTVLILVLAVGFGAYLTDSQYRVASAKMALKQEQAKGALANAEADAARAINNIRMSAPEPTEGEQCNCDCSVLL